MNKPHHTPHAVTGHPIPEWPTVDTTPEADDPLTVLVKQTPEGAWEAVATWAEFSATYTAEGPCDAARHARSALLVILLTPEGER